MPTRRVEDRIRALCARAIVETGPELSRTIQQLQLAIEKYDLRLANATAATMVTGKLNTFAERRTRPKPLRFPAKSY